MFRRVTWLKSHSRLERRMAGDLRRFFQEQAGRLVDRLEDYSGPSPSAVAAVFDPAEEHRLFMAVAEPHLAEAMGQGALLVQRQTTKAATAELSPPWDTPFFQEWWFDIPPGTLARIRLALTELEEQDYWQDIQRETADRATRIISDGVRYGDSPYKISMTLREELGGYEARKRALMIARTECAGALNVGHQCEAEDLEENGMVIEKVWTSVGDRSVRPSHSAASGQRVRGARGLFHVGGTSAPYPCHWSLPARQRVRCRCGVVVEEVAGG